MTKNSKFALIGAGVIIVAGGIFVVSAQGSDDIRSFFHSPQILKNGIQPDLSNSPCDQSATSTPCDQIEAAAKAAPKPVAQAPFTKPVPAYGALVHTYTNEKYSFSFMYPDELYIDTSGGDTLLKAHSSSDNFALKVVTPDVFGVSVNSLGDFEKPVHMANAGESTAYGQMSYEETPSGATIFKTSNGVSVLKEYMTPKVYDSKGNDITSVECEECTGSKLYYIVYKNPQNYIILWSLENNGNETEKIVDSITY